MQFLDKLSRADLEQLGSRLGYRLPTGPCVRKHNVVDAFVKELESSVRDKGVEVGRAAGCEGVVLETGGGNEGAGKEGLEGCAADAGGAATVVSAAASGGEKDGEKDGAGGSDGEESEAGTSDCDEDCCDMMLAVEDQMGGRFMIPVAAVDTIYSVKTQIRREKRLKPSQQELIFGETLLADDKTLNFYGVRDKDTVRLILRLEAAAKNPVKKGNTKDARARDKAKQQKKKTAQESSSDENENLASDGQNKDARLKQMTDACDELLTLITNQSTFANDADLQGIISDVQTKLRNMIDDDADIFDAMLAKMSTKEAKTLQGYKLPESRNTGYMTKHLREVVYGKELQIIEQKEKALARTKDLLEQVAWTFYVNRYLNPVSLKMDHLRFASELDAKKDTQIAADALAAARALPAQPVQPAQPARRGWLGR